MSEPFLTEIRIMSFGFAPKNWAMCNGQLMPINQNQATFSLLGTTFGGDGRVTFALPDLRGRVPMHVGNAFTLGTRGGELAHTVTQAEMPQHTHIARASNAEGNTNLPSGRVLAGAANVYGSAAALTTIEPTTVTTAGGSQAHTNMQPYLALNFCIALIGIFPSPN